MDLFTHERTLQRWFEGIAANGGLPEHVVNRETIETRLEYLDQHPTFDNRRTRGGLRNVLRILDLLYDTSILGADESVAPRGCNPLRPDLVLHTSGAHYVLVELKANGAAERQGVQELLAYGAAMKLHAPHVNEFVFMVVAKQWDALLQYSVRSLIMDDKLVLPLQWEQSPDGNIVLRVHSELFEFPPSPSYDPRFALAVGILATQRPVNSFANLRISTYFQHVARKSLQECRRLGQSGCVFSWQEHAIFPTRGLALATVNHHWMEGEGVPGDVYAAARPESEGLSRLIERKAADMRRRTTDDVFALASASESIARLHPQSSLSYELLERFRSRRWEHDASRMEGQLHFESGEFANIDLFRRNAERHQRPMEICGFSAFGELEDFCGRTGLAITTPAELRLLMDEFAAWKQQAKRSERSAPAS